jgi:thymidylate synthase (FAD)
LYVKDNEGYPDGYHYFLNKILELDMFVTSENKYNRLEIHFMYTKLNFQLLELGMEEFMNVAVAKSILTEMKNVNREFDVSYLEKLLFSKKKRNVGDNFKHIVSDNWKVNMVVTFNLRSLKNYFTLRDSGAAYFQIQWLAEEMKKVIPEHYLNLIVKQK